jgi:hypothetical protein
VKCWRPWGSCALCPLQLYCTHGRSASKASGTSEDAVGAVDHTGLHSCPVGATLQISSQGLHSASVQFAQMFKTMSLSQMYCTHISLHASNSGKERITEIDVLLPEVLERVRDVLENRPLHVLAALAALAVDHSVSLHCGNGLCNGSTVVWAMLMLHHLQCAWLSSGRLQARAAASCRQVVLVKRVGLALGRQYGSLARAQGCGSVLGLEDTDLRWRVWWAPDGEVEVGW